jgi:hypothetical protein
MKTVVDAAAVLLVLGSVAGAAAARSPAPQQVFSAEFSFRGTERVLPAAARESIDDAAAKLDALCAGRRSTTMHITYDLAPASLPRTDYQLVGDRLELVRRHLMRFSPKEWHAAIVVDNRVHLGAGPAARDDRVSVSMFCGL